MSYRKITVNDKVYEYVIGKTNTKIKNIGTFLNELIGVDVPVYDQCSCVDWERGKRLGDNCFAGDPDHFLGYKKEVKPSIIKQLILNRNGM